MIFKSIFVISTLLIVAEAATIKPTIYSSEVHKELSKPANTNEHKEKSNHTANTKFAITNTPDLNKTSKTIVDLKTDRKSNKSVEHNDNKFGHEKKTNTYNLKHIHALGAQIENSQTPTESYRSRTDLENDTQKNTSGTATDQTLQDGSIHEEEQKSTIKVNEHSIGKRNSHKQPDKDHVEGHAISYDDNQTHNTDQYHDTEKSIINQSGIRIENTQSNDVINKSYYNTHSNQIKDYTDTPEEHKESDIRTDTQDSKAKIVKTGQTNIIRDTLTETLNTFDTITDKKIYENSQTKKKSKKYIRNKDGDEATVREDIDKTETDKKSEHSNLVILDNRPKLQTAMPSKQTTGLTATDEIRYHSNLNSEKEIVVKTPITERIENLKNESKSKYYFKQTLPNGNGSIGDEHLREKAGEKIKRLKNSGEYQDEIEKILRRVKTLQK